MATLAQALRRTFVHIGGLPVATDRELLARFVAQQDQAAFAEIVRRHGTLVLRVCQRLLGHDQDAEDAFQATFIVLARKAAVAAARESVGGWLHCVATRTAWHARRLRASRSASAASWTANALRAADPAVSDDQADADWRTLLDEELSRLPEKYRAPLVLCHLEGKTVDEAARLLGSKSGTIKAQLHRGRQQLHGRLARRGVVLAAIPWAGLLPQAANAAVTQRQAAAVVAAALLTVSKQALPAGLVSAQAVVLADATLQGMLWTKVQVGAAILVGLMLVLADASGGKSWSLASPRAVMAAPPPVTLDGVPWNSANMAKVYKDAVLEVWPAGFKPEIVTGRGDHWIVYGQDGRGRGVAVTLIKVPDQPLSRQVFLFEKDGRAIPPE